MAIRCIGVRVSGRENQVQRRKQLAEALWTVAERDGFAAATVRHVAAEAGVSVGMVQHYFRTKDEMVLFALTCVGEELGERLTALIGESSRDPYDVVWIVVSQRLPLHPRSRVHVQALVAWFGSADAAVARYLVEGTRQLSGYVAAQLLLAQEAGSVSLGVDVVRCADGLLALSDGLTSHVLQGVQSVESALLILSSYLDFLFGRSV